MNGINEIGRPNGQNPIGEDKNIKVKNPREEFGAQAQSASGRFPETPFLLRDAVDGIGSLVASAEYEDIESKMLIFAQNIANDPSVLEREMDTIVAYIDESRKGCNPFPEPMENIYRRLSQLKKDGNFSKEFIRIASSHTSEEDKIKFIYNTFTFPYQRVGEGSCFATATLCAMYVNFPLEWMMFVDKIVKENKVDFNSFFAGRNDSELVIDVSTFGQNCGHSSVYQKMVSATASFSKDRVRYEVENRIGKLCLDSQTNGETMKRICSGIAKVLAGDITWTPRGWMPSLIIPLLDKEMKCIKMLTKEIKEITFKNKKRLNFQKAEEMAKRICRSGGAQGGSPKEIVHRIQPKNEKVQQEIKTLEHQREETYIKFTEITDKLMKAYSRSEECEDLEKERDDLSRKYDDLCEKKKILNKFINTHTINSTLCKGSKLTTTEAQSLFDVLEFGSSQDKSQKLKPGLFLQVAYACYKQEIKDGKLETISSGHSMSFISGHYDLNSMKIGDKIRIGHMNYVGNAGNMYMERNNDNEFQLIYFSCGRWMPITRDYNLTELDICPDFLTQYEPVQA